MAILALKAICVALGLIGVIKGTIICIQKRLKVPTGEEFGDPELGDESEVVGKPAMIAGIMMISAGVLLILAGTFF